MQFPRAKQGGSRLVAGAAALVINCAFLLHAADSNPRWSFLVTNLEVFPGTEKIFEPDPTLFWRLKPNLEKVRAAERLPDAEYPFQVSTDADGRRRTPAAPDGAGTVLFLGDSTTFGIPVNDEDSFPARVQHHLKGVRCINAGVPGYSAYQGRLLLETAGARIKPDAVVITFWPNGRTVWDHLSDHEHAELLAAERTGELSRHRLTRLLRRVTPGERQRLNEEEFAAEIRAIIKGCRELGAVPVVQIWPARNQMADSGLVVDRQQILRQVARESGARTVDLVSAFRAEPGEKLFVDSVHATKLGYELAAKRLSAVLDQVLGARR